MCSISHFDLSVWRSVVQKIHHFCRGEYLHSFALFSTFSPKFTLLSDDLAPSVFNLFPILFEKIEANIMYINILRSGHTVHNRSKVRAKGVTWIFDFFSKNATHSIWPVCVSSCPITVLFSDSWSPVCVLFLILIWACDDQWFKSYINSAETYVFILFLFFPFWPKLVLAKST